MRRHILITGGSSGIGAGIAQIAASYGYNITICGLESSWAAPALISVA